MKAKLQCETKTHPAICLHPGLWTIIRCAEFIDKLMTCPPEHGVIEERELHLGVMLQRGPASRGCDVDVGDIERNLHRQEGLSRVPNLEE